MFKLDKKENFILDPYGVASGEVPFKAYIDKRSPKRYKTNLKTINPPFSIFFQSKENELHHHNIIWCPKHVNQGTHFLELENKQIRIVKDGKFGKHVNVVQIEPKLYTTRDSMRLNNILKKIQGGQRRSLNDSGRLHSTILIMDSLKLMNICSSLTTFVCSKFPSPSLTSNNPQIFKISTPFQSF